MKSPEPQPDRRLCLAASVIVLLAAGIPHPVFAADERGSAAKPGGKDSGAGQKADPAKPAAEGEAAAAGQATLANSGLKSFGSMIPLGRESKGVRIPSFDEGKPASVITADSLVRVDDNRIFAEKMTIKMFAEQAAQDVRVDLKTATYNMDHQILSSTDRSRVSRGDFELEGNGMVFDTKTSQGKMVGDVRMTIYDMRELAKNMGMAPEPADEKTKPDSSKPVAPSAADAKKKNSKSKASPKS